MAHATLETDRLVDHLGATPAPARPGVVHSIYPRDLVSLDRLGLDIWRYGILVYCDLMVLLRVYWLNRRLRRLLSDPEFIVEYQEGCWFLQPRYCRCARNIFYVNVQKLLDFTRDWQGEDGTYHTRPARTLADASIVLRHFGRTPDMLVQSLQRSGGSGGPPLREPLPVTRLDPNHNPHFCDGFLQLWVEDTMVPVPRICSHPVEFRRCIQPSSFRPTRMETETLLEFEQRQFWREFHPVTDEMIRCVQKGEDPRTVTPPEQLKHGFQPPEVDLLQQWFDHCAANGLDPYDPMVDDEDCRGFRSIRWARLKMFETSVGGSSYPLELCVHGADLRGTASRLGVDYIDRMYVNMGRYRGADPDWNTMEHHGVLYLMGIRYENEPEDFVPWVLNTQALLHSVYAHMWLDAMAQWTRFIQRHLHSLATEIEEDLGFDSLRRRWQYLRSLCYANPSVFVPLQYSTPAQRARDQDAIHVVCNNHYLEENRFLSHLVDRDGARDGNYMTHLVEQFTTPPSNTRTESQRVHDAYRLIRFAEYVTEFAEYVAPRVDDRTRSTRRRAFEIYLHALIPLILFCPGWKRTFHWKPSRTHEETHWYIPRIRLEHNHRYQHYLNYCNRRTLYYHPDPSLLLNNAAQDATQGWRG